MYDNQLLNNQDRSKYNLWYLHEIATELVKDKLYPVDNFA